MADSVSGVLGDTGEMRAIRDVHFVGSVNVRGRPTQISAKWDYFGREGGVGSILHNVGLGQVYF